MKREITTMSQLHEFVEWFKLNTTRGISIGLEGELGAGKTTFVRTLIERIATEMGKPTPRVTSPTYVIQTRYPQLDPCIEHFDLYRLEKADRKALNEIGYFDASEYVEEKGGWLFVEWPSKAALVEDLNLGQVIRFLLDGSGRWVEFGR